MNLRSLSMVPGLVVFVAIATLFLLVGCVGSNGKVTVTNEHPALDYEFTGIPLLFFGFGTSTPITPELSLTVAHVAKLNYDKVVAYHPYCDIAIVKSNNSALDYPNLGLVFPNQPVRTFGMSPTGDVLTGSGRYRRDLLLVEVPYFKKCPASVTDAPVQDGMSGGGVYNDNGSLVGIIAARANPRDIRLLSGEPHGLERISIFVPLNYVRDWLEGAVDDFYGNQQYSLRWEKDDKSMLVKN
ncbi:serine protease [Vibrio hepatarius]|uniref:serine protease n=1 Tax=Vibrio hepatarius TaxID=171383 RepID=UPI0020CA92FB|nr:serine protease [Vibrio hepatarius]